MASNTNSNTDSDAYNNVEIHADAKSPDDLQLQHDPGADTGKIINDTAKDHPDPWIAAVTEGFQNAVDAWSYRKHENHIDTDLHVHFRVTPDENTVEIIDNAGGLNGEEIKNDLLPVGSSGHRKDEVDSVGSQGKGFWGIVLAGKQAVVETHTHTGERYQVKVAPKDPDIARVINNFQSRTSNITAPETPRPELDEPGTYVRVEDVLESDGMDTLTDWDTVSEYIKRKFAFIYSRPDVEFTYEIVGDGKYHPPEYDFRKLREEGGVEEVDSTLRKFTKFNKQRQLTGLNIIDNRKTSSSSDPPWNGIAMLKGGEFLDHPYFSVWIYTPNNPLWQNGDLWGWVNANSLCPDLEDHGHNGFKYPPYNESGLKHTADYVANDVMGGLPAMDQEESSQDIADTIQELATEDGPIDPEDYESTTETDVVTRTRNENRDPEDPEVYCSAGKYAYEPNTEIPLSVSITNPGGTGIDEFFIIGQIVRIVDENGEEIKNTDEDSDREIGEVMKQFGPLENYIVEQGVTEKKRVANGEYKTKNEGLYRFEAMIYPELDTEKASDLSISEKIESITQYKPVLDTDQSNFNVGDITTPYPDREHSVGGPGLINNVSWTKEPDNPKRAYLVPDGDSYSASVNQAHPEYKLAIHTHGQQKQKEIKTDKGVKWGLLPLLINHYRDELEEALQEKGVFNDAIGEIVTDTFNEMYSEHERIRHKFVSEKSPLTDETVLDEPGED